MKNKRGWLWLLWKKKNKDFCFITRWLCVCFVFFLALLNLKVLSYLEMYLFFDIQQFWEYSKFFFLLKIIIKHQNNDSAPFFFSTHLKFVVYNRSQRLFIRNFAKQKETIFLISQIKKKKTIKRESDIVIYYIIHSLIKWEQRIQFFKSRVKC